MNCCTCIPSIGVTSVNIDETTGIATIVVDATSLPAGKFNLCFKLCGQCLSPCWTQTVNIVAGTTTYANVLQRDGNFIRLGQLARQVNCCRVVHCNLTASPSGNVMVLDKVPCCAFSGTVGRPPTILAVES